MGYRYGISSVLMQDQQLEIVLPKISAGGFKELEVLCEPPQFDGDRTDLAKLSKLLDDYGLSVRVGHGPYSKLNCGSLDEAERKRSVAKIVSYFEPLAEIGAEVVVAHPNSMLASYDQRTRQRCRDQSVKSVEELLKPAAKVNIKIALENLPHYGTGRPFHSMSELLELINPMPDYVGLCLDTTHAKISGHNPLDELNVAADRLFSLHLHDTDGEQDRHWTPGRGIIEWDSFIARLDAMGFSGPRIMEVIADGDDPDQVLKECFATTTQWATDCG